MERKKNRLLTDALFGDNQLSKELIITELTKLYEENYQGRIDKDQYDALILNIPMSPTTKYLNLKSTSLVLEKSAIDKKRYLN